jgi:hypothetical protein
MAPHDENGNNGNGNGRFKVSGQTLLQLAVWLVSIMLAYGALNERISVLEVKYDRMQQDLGEIKGDVKQLLRRP